MVLFRTRRSIDALRPSLTSAFRSDSASTTTTAFSRGSGDGVGPAQAALQKLGQPSKYRQDETDLRDLNLSLAALVQIFPDVQIEVFREMLASISDASRLAVVADLLVRDKAKWTRGRLRVPEPGRQQQGVEDTLEAASPLLPQDEAFRTPTYTDAVKALCYLEFKSLSKSTINAVLAEFNYSYTLGRPELTALSTKSWKHILTSFFARNKFISSTEAEKHPLVIWQSTGSGPLIPTLKGTGSQELDKELFDSLILPLQQRIAKQLAASDLQGTKFSTVVDDVDGEGQFECECCFASVMFEQVVACDDGCHLFCYECVQRGINEAVFGQGWQKNINLDRGTLSCMAAFSDDCNGCITIDSIQRALADLPTGKEVLHKLDERLTQEAIMKSTLPLIRCPFCAYTEIDDLYIPNLQSSWRIKSLDPSSYVSIFAIVLCMGSIPFLLPVFLFLSAVFVIVCARQSFANYALKQFYESVKRLRRKRIGLRFTCRNPECGRFSCLSCSKAWIDIHQCHESTLLALRTQIELAMSQAVKRTCPQCNTLFVKSAGCNKLTCVCGYQMCYVCRQDIGKGEGYRHFCEHFRPTASGQCNECSKCDLYRCEDDEVSVRRAKAAAEKAWFSSEGRSLAPGEQEELKKVLAGTRTGPIGRGESWLEMMRTRLAGLSLDNVLDALLEQIVE